MTLEKCAIREIADCQSCERNTVVLRDRRGVEFPILREWEHRNVIYNSLPTGMSDRTDQLLRASLTAWHFIFSTEQKQDVDRVIDAYRKKTGLNCPIRRI